MILLPQKAGERASERASVRTVVLDLQRDELWLQGPFGGRAVHTEVDVCEKREGCFVEPTAAPDASGEDVVWTFLHMFLLLVPGGIKPDVAFTTSTVKFYGSFVMDTDEV